MILSNYKTEFRVLPAVCLPISATVIFAPARIRCSLSVVAEFSDNLYHDVARTLLDVSMYMHALTHARTRACTRVAHRRVAGRSSTATNADERKS